MVRYIYGCTVYLYIGIVYGICHHDVVSHSIPILPGEIQLGKLLDYLPEHIRVIIFLNILYLLHPFHTQIHRRFLRFAYSVIASENRILTLCASEPRDIADRYLPIKSWPGPMQRFLT